MTVRPELFARVHDSLYAAYQQLGCYVMEHPVVPPSLLERARRAATALERGEYASGLEPWRVIQRRGSKGLLKIDQAHLSDPALFELVTHPAIGALAAEVSGAKRVQAWATQLLVKPCGGSAAGCVGWHTDQQYWPWFRGGVFTIWVALDDVLPQSGPVQLVTGSHRWAPGTFLGDALEQDLVSQERAWQARISHAERASLRRVELTLPAGGIAVFDANTLHCSGPNTSRQARRGLAIHLCCDQTQRLTDFDEYGFVRRLSEQDKCPIIFDTSPMQYSR